MSDANTTGARVVTALGACAVAAGVLLNEWVLAAFLTDDGNITPSHRIAVWVVDLAAVAVGLLLIRNRARLRPTALLVGLLSLLLSLTAAEFVVRRLDARKTRDYLLLRENPHGTGSYRLKPNLDLLYQWEIFDETRYLHVQTNSLGMRWPEPPDPDAPKQKQRVVLLGDSFTFGESATENAHTFASVFARQLDSERFLVLNFGVPGFGPPDAELIFEEEALRFEPDYVVFMLYTGNDFRDSFLGRDKYDVSRGDAVWYPELLNARVPAEFRPPGGYVSERVGATPLLWNLHLFRRFSRGLKVVEQVFHDEPPPPPSTFSLDRFEVSNDFLEYTFWSRAEYPPTAVEAKDLTLACLERIRARCAERGARLLIAAIPTREQVYCKQPTGVSSNGVAYDIGLPQRFVAEYAAAHDVPYLDLLPLFRAGHERGDPDVFPDLTEPRGDIHLNDLGHAVLGGLLAEFFEAHAGE